MIEGRAIAVDDKDPTADYSAETAAMLKRMADWAQQMAGHFPADPPDGRGYSHAKIPAKRWLVAPPIVTSAVQAECAQRLIEAAHNLSRAQPRTRSFARVAAIIDYPDMISSEVCVVFDPSYWACFAQRDHDNDRWTPLPAAESLAKRLQLTVPAGFVEQGYRTYLPDPDWEPPGMGRQGEVWIYSDLPTDD